MKTLGTGWLSAVLSAVLSMSCGGSDAETESSGDSGADAATEATSVDCRQNAKCVEYSHCDWEQGTDTSSRCTCRPDGHFECSWWSTFPDVDESGPDDGIVCGLEGCEQGFGFSECKYSDGACTLQVDCEAQTVSDTCKDGGH